jgi:uroporphyrinogen-III synthase
LRQALARPGLRVAAQGVVCASAFARHGVAVDVIPQRGSMGALVQAIARSLHEPVACAAPRSGLLALVVCGEVSREAVRQTLAGLPEGARLALLAGRGRQAERWIELAALERGLAIQRVPPVRGARHPADALVRRASRVLVLSGGGGGELALKPLLQLAARYAKPLDVIPLD